ncbi:MAG TPA: tRNA pseudouridine(13) synthase TruD [Gammaproteobacteria bacterium]|nr:tRNA pseudouridine(13) synthase TruD [Gammaproteobacteria bacterium]
MFIQANTGSNDLSTLVNENSFCNAGFRPDDYEPAKVYQPLNLAAKIKSRPEDFIVREEIAIDFSGEGEHCWIYLEKRLSNTDYVAQQLARFCDVKSHAVAYAGLKDRHALTSQWFSVHMPGRETPDWAVFEQRFNENDRGESVRILESRRHNKKLQRGALKKNGFELTCRELSDTSDNRFAALDERCRMIAANGVANYFGPQRFGRDYGNLEQAAKMFRNSRRRLPRHKRSLYLSAARSWLFNRIVSQRVEQGVWNRRLPGDVFMLAGKSACFRDDGSEALQHRLENNDIHPTAALWGEGDSMVSGTAAELEREIIDRFPVYRDGLVCARVQAARRACRLLPEGMSGRRAENDYIINFSLPAGSYATEVLAEIFSELKDGGR